jgi:L-ribulokinase
VCCGGIAEKNPLLMQIYADVTGCVMQVSASDQTCALGAALAAAVAAGPGKGGYSSFAAAQKKMTGVKAKQYTPDPKSQRVYSQLYKIYRQLYDGFGGVVKRADYSRVMKDLIEIKERQS